MRILQNEAYTDGIKRKGDNIGMGYMKHGRFEHTDTPNTITQSLYCCLGEVLNIHHCNLRTYSTKKSCS